MDLSPRRQAGAFNWQRTLRRNRAFTHLRRNDSLGERGDNE